MRSEKSLFLLSSLHASPLASQWHSHSWLCGFFLPSSPLFLSLLRLNKTTLSKWENSEDPITLQRHLPARTIVISRDKRLENRAADHTRAFEKIADQQKRVRVEVDAEKLAYE